VRFLIGDFAQTQKSAVQNDKSMKKGESNNLDPEQNLDGNG
jgi:hypothetical protein